MMIFKRAVQLATTAFLLFACLSAIADSRTTLWQVEGKSNRIYLLGSIHLLRASDYPLPPAIESAYADADTLVMELDMDDMDPLAMQGLVMELGMLPPGTSLEDALGPTHYQRAASMAAEIQVPITMMGTMKPWLAAMTVEVLIMSRLGFDPNQGVEMHLMRKAGTDGKEIRGFESERDQLEILDGLSSAAQRDMLLSTLEEGGKLADLLDDLIVA